MAENNNVYLDIKTPWLSVLRSMQAQGRSQRGIAVMNITIVINSEGLPLWWTTPRLTKLEPKSQADQIVEFLKDITSS